MVEKTGGMTMRMTDCLSVDTMALSLAEKMAAKLDVSLVEETAEMMVTMSDCSSAVIYKCTLESIFHVLHLC